MINKIDDYLKGKLRVAIAGHQSPDGDCIGACMGLYLYIQDNFPRLQADVYMPNVSPIYDFIDDIEKKHTTCRKEDWVRYDLLILLDISSKDRVSVAGNLLTSPIETLCLDHHKTNNDKYTYFYNDPAASSTCEVLYRHLQESKISKRVAEVLYMGITHDTGVFRYKSTSPETLRIAAALMEKGIDFAEILDKTFYQKTIGQQKIQGYVLESSESFCRGKFIVGTVTKKDRERAGVKSNELEGIVAILRDTIGVEVAMLISETDTGEMKISLRSRSFVDVAEICATFGGGGHMRAAGCKFNDTRENIINRILPYVQAQLGENV